MIIGYSETRKTTIIKTVFSAVAYIDVRAGTIDLYGLGDCGTFDVNGKRYARYIEGSEVAVEQGVISENNIPRKHFTSPTTILRLGASFDVRLQRIYLGGTVGLKGAAAACIDDQSVFNLTMRGGTRLLGGLPAARVCCTMDAGAVLSTGVETSASTRRVWQLAELELIMNGVARVSGVHVTDRFKIVLHTGDDVNIDVGVGDECVINTWSSVVQATHDEIMGRAPPVPRRPITNEHGMIVFVDVEEPVPQAVLDDSRAAYEAEARPSSATPLFSLSGNTKHEDEPAPDSASSCRVCMTNKAVVVMANCGHMAACVSCTESMRYCLSTCPLCRKEIVTAVIPFF